MNRFLNILNEETKNLTKPEQKEVLNRLFEIYPNLEKEIKKEKGNERRVFGIRKQTTTPDV